MKKITHPLAREQPKVVLVVDELIVLGYGGGVLFQVALANGHEALQDAPLERGRDGFVKVHLVQGRHAQVLALDEQEAQKVDELARVARALQREAHALCAASAAVEKALLLVVEGVLLG
jgi:hypothetical protein